MNPDGFDLWSVHGNEREPPVRIGNWEESESPISEDRIPFRAAGFLRINRFRKDTAGKSQNGNQITRT